ncbi:MAG: hypothetical protein K2R98_27175 [Gemmataceae bacterium]|nr:hypothetical protein [Gemmataceae bacterium]
MLTTLAFVAAMGMAPAQGGKLDLTNVRPTYGVLGAARPDTKFLPGDVFFLAFDIENITVASDGRVLYGMGMEVTDGKGKVWFEQKPDDKIQAVNSLGSSKLPAFANVDIGLNMPAGIYTLKVTVIDRAVKPMATKDLNYKFEVVKSEFGLVRLTTFLDAKGETPAPMVGVPGQFIHVNFVAVGFTRDKGKKQPNILVEMRIIDDATGKPTLAKPFSGEVNEVDPKYQSVPMGFGVALNRPGNYTVELKATDVVDNKKTYILKFPLKVLTTDVGKTK